VSSRSPSQSRTTNIARRSLKDLTKAISSPTNLTLPLPDDLIQLLNNYLEKHLPHEDTDSQRLHEELLTIYDTHVLPSPSRLGPFLAILTTLKPAIRGSGRLLQWWDKLAEPVLQHISGEKGLAFQARKTLLDILIHGEDEEAESEMQDAKETSDKISQDLIEIWLLKTRLANEEFDKNALFIEGQLRLILLAFGKKRPKVRFRAFQYWKQRC
jgi:solute carrier family 25 protein 16